MSLYHSNPDPLREDGVAPSLRWDFWWRQLTTDDLARGLTFVVCLLCQLPTQGFGDLTLLLLITRRSRSPPHPQMLRDQARVGIGTSLVVQQLRLQASTAGGTGSIPGWGIKILHASQHGQNNKKKKDRKTGLKVYRNADLKG